MSFVFVIVFLAVASSPRVVAVITSLAWLRLDATRRRTIPKARSDFITDAMCAAGWIFRLKQVTAVLNGHWSKRKDPPRAMEAFCQSPVRGGTAESRHSLDSLVGHGSSSRIEAQPGFSINRS